MLGLIGVRKPVSRLLRGNCSDQHCGPERAWWVGQLGMLEYYIYTPSTMARSPLACGGQVRTHGLTVAFLYNHV